jgi:hypothetical protein
MGGPSPEKGPGNRRQLQIDTTQKRLKAIPFQMPTESSFAVNRTVVMQSISTRFNQGSIGIHLWPDSPAPNTRWPASVAMLTVSFTDCNTERL